MFEREYFEQFSGDDPDEDKLFLNDKGAPLKAIDLGKPDTLANIRRRAKQVEKNIAEINRSSRIDPDTMKKIFNI